jgi:hypothetical protein
MRILFSFKVFNENHKFSTTFDCRYEVMKGCWGPENEHRPKISTVVSQLGELTGVGDDHEDIYVNLGTVEGYYENQDGLGKPKRKAPQPPMFR